MLTISRIVRKRLARSVRGEPLLLKIVCGHALRTLANFGSGEESYSRARIAAKRSAQSHWFFLLGKTNDYHRKFIPATELFQRVGKKKETDYYLFVFLRVAGCEAGGSWHDCSFVAR